jgi:hypothetical protein
MTNGEWVRRMTDEQICVAINLIVKQVVLRVHKEPYIEGEFLKATIDWLKAEQNENGLLFKTLNKDSHVERETQWAEDLQA